MGEPQAVVVNLPGWRQRFAAASAAPAVRESDPDEGLCAAAVAAWQEKVPPRFRRAVPLHPAVAHWARSYARDREGCSSLYLCGKTGTGKTHQAYMALHAVAQCGTRAYAWQAATVADLFGSLRGKGFAQSETALAAVCASPLLLLDDLGAAHLTDWTEEVIYRLINGRYERCAPTLFTSNYPLSSLGSIVGERVVSRMTEMVGEMGQVPMTGVDRRMFGGGHGAGAPGGLVP